MTHSTAPRLLRIDASARQADSHSRHLADRVQAGWQAAHPGGLVLARDLALQPVPQLSAATIQGFYTPADQMTPALREATALSDALIDELLHADLLLISAPIYNFSVPAALKAWIDQVVRIGRTFAYADGQFRGLVTRPRAVLALAYGAGGYGGPMASMDHLRPYLESLLGFLGLTQIDVVGAEALNADAATAAQALAAAERSAAALF